MAIWTTSGELEYPLDGINVINLYSRGETKLGRMLTHMAPVKFTHPVYGEFPSMEHYWHWVRSGKCIDEFRTLKDSFAVKKFSKDIPPVFNPNFEQDILEGEKYKLASNPWLEQLLFDSELPLAHYYVYGKQPNWKILDNKPDQRFWVKYFADVRLGAAYMR